ncbi:hypothetical protein POM88_048416 [Heracleum sosnowskyi]|uniref:Subtilisin-like protease fibronectin type-III domain-containing protein n=1 Tax=Heracleum sosnowskyi TaxID=360622 RepID=A0AAD8GTS7_9APIA|nr:hypothetical protein POM88_048416 [Heracleum sosnowskyi]
MRFVILNETDLHVRDFAALDDMIDGALVVGSAAKGLEFAYGAGAFNLTKAIRPGLVYEEEVKSYDEYIFGNRIPHCDLNLPYFSAMFPLSSGKMGCYFRRKMKNVEEGRCAYTTEVVVHATTLSMPLEAVIITVDPQSLFCKGLNEEQKFLLNVDLPHTNSGKEYIIVSCSLIWTNKDDVSIVVRSPIILSTKYTSVRIFEP